MNKSNNIYLDKLNYDVLYLIFSLLHIDSILDLLEVNKQCKSIALNILKTLKNINFLNDTLTMTKFYTLAKLYINNINKLELSNNRINSIRFKAVLAHLE